MTSAKAARGSRDSSASVDTQAIAIPTYVNSRDGLEKFIGDVFRAAKTEDSATLNTLVAALSQPVAASWFQNTFGEDGDAMFKEYSGSGPRLDSTLHAFFAKLSDEQFASASAIKHEASCDDSGESIYPVMVLRQQPMPLYELRFHEKDKFDRLWVIAYVDGGFPYIGDLKPPDFRNPPLRKLADGKPANATNQKVKRVLQSQNLIDVKRMYTVHEQYPEKARAEHIQGTVRLHAIIPTGGTIRLLRVQSGYCSLSEAAMKAVRQWRYQPTILHGAPVEVDTTIESIFALQY